MNRFLLFILIALTCIAGGCKKENSDSGQVMTAVIDNRGWRSLNSRITLDKSSGIRLVINADSANTSMNLSIANYTGLGKYVISDSGTTATYTNGGVLHKATSGEIIITDATTNGTNLNKFKGTFNFLADTVQVTAGTFDVNLFLN